MSGHTMDELERRYPRVHFMPDTDGIDECPECHGEGFVTQEAPTLSPSDACQVTCRLCDGDGEITIVDAMRGAP